MSSKSKFLYKIPFLLSLFLLLSLCCCTSVKYSSLYSSDDKSLIKENENLYPCIAKRIKINSVKYSDISKKNYSVFSEFSHNFAYELDRRFYMIARKSEMCFTFVNKFYDIETIKKLHLLKNKDLEFKVDILYTASKSPMEIGNDSYAKNTRIKFDVTYITTIQNKELVRKYFTITSGVMIPKSGYGYMLGIEDLDNNLSNFIAENISIQILQNIIELF